MSGEFTYQSVGGSVATLREPLVPVRGEASGRPRRPEMHPAAGCLHGAGGGSGNGAGGGSGGYRAGPADGFLPANALVDGALTLALMAWCVVFALTVLVAG